MNFGRGSDRNRRKKFASREKAFKKPSVEWGCSSNIMAIRIRSSIAALMMLETAVCNNLGIFFSSKLCVWVAVMWFFRCGTTHLL
jgi:hypothetical protein